MLFFRKSFRVCRDSSSSAKGRFTLIILLNASGASLSIFSLILHEGWFWNDGFATQHANGVFNWIIWKLLLDDLGDCKG